MQRITRARLVLSLALVGALALAGCGGDDAYNISAEDQARIDTLTDDVAAANKKAADDLAMAQARIDALTVEIGMMPSDDAEGSGLKGQLAMAQADLMAAQMRVGELTVTIGMAADGEMAATGLYKDLADAEVKVMMYMAMIGSMDDPASTEDGASLHAMLNAAKADRDKYMAMIGSMDDEASMEEGASLHAMLNAAKADRDKYMAMIGSMDDEAAADGSLYAQLAVKQDMIDSLQSDLNEVNRMLAELKGEVDTGDMMTKVDMAKKLNAALMNGGVEMYEHDTPDVQAMVRNMAVKVKELTASMDGTLSVKLQNKMLGATPPETDSPTIARAALDGYTMDDMPDMVDGWRGATLKKETATVNAMAVVYTDIMDTAGGRFDGRYDASLDAMRMKRYLLTNEIAAGDNSKPILWSNGKLDVKAQLTRTGPPESATGKSAYPGSVHDVPGMFYCMETDTACGDLNRQSNGSVVRTVEASPWYFMPTDPDAIIATVTDDKYLTFGWWLDRGDGTKPYYFDAFAVATGMADGPDTTAIAGDGLLGKATYEGAAAGKYTILGVSEDTAESGHFTASAMLAADFDANATGTTDPDMNGVMITGMIDEFMTGDMSRSDWTVKLKSTDTSDNGEIPQYYTDLSAAIMGDTEWSMGGAAMSGMGKWNAMFYGGGPTTFPEAVTGTFYTNGDVGSLSGAFGAMEE